MATGPSSRDSGPKQPGRTGQDDGSYFEGEGRDPFEQRAGDADSQEAEAVVDDLISEFTGSGAPAAPSSPTGSAPASGAPAGGGAAPRGDAGTPQESAGTSGTSRGSTSQAPGAGRMG